MRVKQYKGKVFGADLTKKEQEALRIEIKRQLAEANREFEDEIDSTILYVLHECFGFGKTRLRRFYEAVTKELRALEEYYEMPGEGAWICQKKLKDIGVDVEAWNKEENK